MALTSAIVIVVLLFAVQAGLWIAIVLWLQKREAAVKQSLWAECIAGGEVVTMRPRSALFQGALPREGLRRGNGVLVITEKRVLFQKLAGGRLEIPRAEIVEVADRWKGRAKTSRSASREMIVIRRRDKRQYGFLLKSADEVRKALAGS